MKDFALTRAVFWSACVLAVGFVLYATVRSPSRSLPVYSQLASFVLTNQDNRPVSLLDLRGQVCVADVIYTRCPSQCIKMTYQMGQLQAALPRDLCVKLVSITTDPTFDTPPILRNYGLRNGAKENWLFLTGEKKTICQLAVDGMKLGIEEKTPGENEDPNDIFVHSAKFVLIDKLGRVRGYYSGDSGESQPELLSDIKLLVKEKL